MRKIFTLMSLILIAAFPSFAQTAESHNFITYDTVIHFSGSSQPYWVVRISRPANMFTRNHPDTASRPVFITMPGSGEVSSDTNTLKGKTQVFGPHYWLSHGWDGSVVLGNGTHYPILMTVCVNTLNVRPNFTRQLIDTLRRRYHIKWNSMHFAGLSMGGWTWGRLLTYSTDGVETSAMSMMRSFVSLQGNAADNFNGVSFGFTAYRKWVQKYDGRYFALEGTQDTRNLWIQRDSMVLAGSTKAYFSYENLGGGTHCCWNSMYDPSATNWRSVAPITNTYLTVNTYHPNSMGNYIGGSVFQWMLRQGDTSIVGTATSNLAPVANAGTDKTITLPTNSLTLAGSGTDADGTIKSYSWSKVSGPTQFTISNIAITNPVISNLIAGTYVFRLTVTDNAGATAYDDVTITVIAQSAASPAPSGKAIPGQIEAENYDAMSGIKTQTTTDANGGLNVGWIDAGDWMDYNLTVAAAGTYTASFRVATTAYSTGFQLKAASGAVLATVTFSSTGGYQTWKTVTASVTLPAGNQTLRVYSTGTATWNFNWMSFSSQTAGTAAATSAVTINSEQIVNPDSLAGKTSSLVIYPNPVRDQLIMEVNNGHTGKMLIQMISPTGAILRSFYVNKDQFYSRTELATGGLAAGMYFIRMQIGNWAEIRKVLKQ